MNKPVAYMYDFPNPDDPTEIIKDWTAYSLDEVARNKGVNVRPLYLSPPQREWVGLTDEERRFFVALIGFCTACFAGGIAHD